MSLLAVCIACGYSNKQVDRQPAPDMRLSSILSVMANLVLREATQDGDASISTSFVHMPKLCYYAAVPTSAIGFQLFFVPFIVSFLFPPFAVALTSERTRKLFHGLAVKGVTDSVYWLSNWLYGFIVFSAFGLAYCGIAIGMDMKSFTNCGFNLLTAISLLWAHGQVMLSFLLSAVFDDPRSSGILAYVLLFTMAIAGGIINNPEQGGLEPYPWYDWQVRKQNPKV